MLWKSCRNDDIIYRAKDIPEGREIMELDIIILPKSGNEVQTQLELKQKLIEVFKKIYEDVQKIFYRFTLMVRK